MILSLEFTRMQHFALKILKISQGWHPWNPFGGARYAAPRAVGTHISPQFIKKYHLNKILGTGLNYTSINPVNGLSKHQRESHISNSAEFRG